MLQVFLFFFLIFWQAEVFTVPFFLVILLLFSIFGKKNLVFLLAFFGGLLCDVLTVRPLGVTAIFLLVFSLIVVLYERKFEVMTLPFVGFVGFLGSFFYLLIFSYSHIFLQAVVASFTGIILFVCFSFFSRSFERGGKR